MKKRTAWNKGISSKIIKNCLTCEKEFKVYPSREKYNCGKYCSHKCRPTVWNKGKKGVQKWTKHQRDVMENIIPWNKGKKVPQMVGNTFGFKKGLPPWNKGKKGVMKPNSGSFKKGQFLGKDHFNWKGGTTPENMKIRHSLEIKLWRKSVFERDDFTCQKTGEQGGNLAVHHINNFSDFPELRTSIENGITLSKKSHIEFHKKYGRKNNSREQLKEFLINK